VSCFLIKNVKFTLSIKRRDRERERKSELEDIRRLLVIIQSINEKNEMNKNKNQRKSKKRSVCNAKKNDHR